MSMLMLRKVVLEKSKYPLKTIRGLSVKIEGRGGGAEEEDDQQSFHLPNPNPNPNRPLRGDRDRDSRPQKGRRAPAEEVTQQRPSFQTQKHQHQHQHHPVDTDSFLEKFKLGFHPNQGQQTAPTPTPTPTPTRDNSTDGSTTAESPEAEDADEIFKKMKETGLIPNAVAMLDALCKDGLPQEAMKLFALMREKGTIPEVVIYTAVIQGFCKAHKFDDAKRIFAKMHTNRIPPNAFTYTVLIQGLSKGGPTCLYDALQFTLEMLEAGHSPNVLTFTTLVYAFCNHKGVEEAKSVVNTLRDKGFFLNDKAIRDHLDKKGPSSPLLREAIFGKKTSQTFF